MKLHEKLKKYRKSLGLTILDVHDLQVKDYGAEGAISPRTLERIEAGESSKFPYIIKICHTLGIQLTDLLKDTDYAEQMVIQNKKRFNSYTYNQLAHGEIVSAPSSSFTSMELTLEPGGKTAKEQSPIDGKRYEKHIYVLEGSIACIVSDEKHFLKRRDTISFNSSLLHWIENTSKSRSLCLIYQTPKFF